MTSRERLLKAARREEVDTIPISPRLGYASTLHFGRNDLFAQLRLKEVYDYDPTFILPGNHYPFFDPFATFKDKPNVRVEMDIVDEGRTRTVKKRYTTPDGRLSEEYMVPNPGHPEFGESPNPVHKEFLVKEESDLGSLRHLMPDPDPDLGVRYMNTQEVIGEKGLCLATVYGALDHQAGSAMSMEDIMVACLTDPSFAQAVINLFQDQLIAQTRTLLEAGVRQFFCPYYYHSISAGWSPALFREWFVPLIREQTDLIHEYEGLVFYYDDGKHMQIMPFLVDIGIDVVETCTPPPVGDFDLAEAGRLYGDRIAMKGYVDLIYVLQRGTADNVREAVRFACRTGSRRGFILGTSDSMRAGTPKENIDAYFRYGREFGVL